MDMLTIAVDIGKRFPSERTRQFANNPLASMIRNDWRSSFYQAFPQVSASNVKAKASAGMGQWNAAPFMAFLDTRITTSPQSGYYPVILYERGFESFCLVMAQGADLLKTTFGTKEALSILKSRVPLIQAAAPGWARKGFGAGPFQTYSRGDTGLGRTADDPWAVSVAFGKRYRLASPPPLQEFIDDLAAMLALYENVVAKIGHQFIEQERVAEQLSLSGELPTPGTEIFGLDGALRISEHKTVERRSRNTRLVKQVKAILGSTCQGCGVTLSSTYGHIGTDFIEAHHLTPLGDMPSDGRKLSLSDFAVLCPTCHRIIHRLGCPKLDVLRRTVNPKVRDFYEKLLDQPGAA
jgi:5-methylcytosine-specific restriction protein A